MPAEASVRTSTAPGRQKSGSEEATGRSVVINLPRTLTKPEFGAFEYALTLAGSARILLSLGQGRLLSRFMATYDEEGVPWVLDHDYLSNLEDEELDAPEETTELDYFAERTS